MLQCNPDLENEPIELTEILHTAPFWWYKNKSPVAFCRQKSFCWPKTQFLGPKMAIFWVFLFWRPISQQGLLGAAWSRTLLLFNTSCSVYRGVCEVSSTNTCRENWRFLRIFWFFRFCLCRFSPFFRKWPAQGTTPAQIYHGANHLACLPRFQVPGLSGSKVILLRKWTKIFQIFFSSPLGSKK